MSELLSISIKDSQPTADEAKALAELWLCDGQVINDRDVRAAKDRIMYQRFVDRHWIRPAGAGLFFLPEGLQALKMYFEAVRIWP